MSNPRNKIHVPRKTVVPHIAREICRQASDMIARDKGARFLITYKQIVSIFDVSPSTAGRVLTLLGTSPPPECMGLQIFRLPGLGVVIVAEGSGETGG